MIYFIQAGDNGPVKIGYTKKDPDARMASLQTGSHDKLKLIGHRSGSTIKERELHQTFDKSRIRGEWFEPTSNLLGFINAKSLQEDYDRTLTMKERIAVMLYREHRAGA